MNKYLLFVLSLLTALPNIILGQIPTNSKIEMADAMVENGKIYVVVGVLTIVFVCIFTYLLMLDKKVSKLEKQIKK
jgi:CcmD family protein